jgi:hypothetical protein
MVFSTILSKTLTKIGNHSVNPLKKYTREEATECFVYFPAAIGGVCFAGRGAYEGYEYSKDCHYAANLSCATLGIFYGYCFGTIFGALWPITIPVLVSRQIYGPNITSVKE